MVMMDDTTLCHESDVRGDSCALGVREPVARKLLAQESVGTSRARDFRAALTDQIDFQGEMNNCQVSQQLP